MHKSMHMVGRAFPLALSTLKLCWLSCQCNRTHAFAPALVPAYHHDPPPKALSIATALLPAGAQAGVQQQPQAPAVVVTQPAGQAAGQAQQQAGNQSSLAAALATLSQSQLSSLAGLLGGSGRRVSCVARPGTACSPAEQLANAAHSAVLCTVPAGARRTAHCLVLLQNLVAALQEEGQPAGRHDLAPAPSPDHAVAMVCACRPRMHRCLDRPLHHWCNCYNSLDEL